MTSRTGGGNNKPSRLNSLNLLVELMKIQQKEVICNEV